MIRIRMGGSRFSEEDLFHIFQQQQRMFHEEDDYYSEPIPQTINVTPPEMIESIRKNILLKNENRHEDIIDFFTRDAVVCYTMPSEYSQIKSIESIIDSGKKNKKVIDLKGIVVE